MRSQELNDMDNLGGLYRLPKAETEVVEEGLRDRFQARRAGLKGTYDDIANRARAAVNGTPATAPAAHGPDVRLEAYQRLATEKLEKVAEEIFEDLEKLGISLPGLVPESAGNFKNQLAESFKGVLAELGVSPTVEGNEEEDEESDDDETVTEESVNSDNTVVDLIVESVKSYAQGETAMAAVAARYKDITGKGLSKETRAKLQKKLL